MNKVAILAFIRPFYQRTLGFWAAILLIGGVLMDVKQHVLLSRFLIKNPVAFCFIPVLLLFYSFIHLQIQQELLRRNNYLVFHHLGLYAKKELRLFWSRIILLNFSPILTYFLFLSYFIWEQKAFDLGITLWMSTLILLGFTYRKIRQTLHYPLKEAFVTRPTVRWAFPRFTWILLSLRQDRPLLVLLTKATGLLLLNGFFYSFQSGGYDWRWLQFGILCVAYVQLPLIFEKTEKEITQQSWILALPMTWKNKLGYQMGSLTLLTVPELFFLGWKGVLLTSPENLVLAILLVTFISALQLLVYRKKESSSFPNLAAAMFFGLFIAIIFNVTWWILALPISVLLVKQAKGAFQF
ncbi:MAG: hypothetical protein EP311_11715 [Cytophagales bacterium]|uniref:ABC transporter permease n=1 Tax=Algoriphagus taiwanensis TaxID=1445656 RepID=A0ABQ6PZQ9_9BACT|nr:MAG: hypothetical protein EP311_11715 [Cytophagales bacterium]GMQ33431.1 hypothetical protein Ataiwa_17030 [Algoriphagus taiwanensis]